MSRKRCSATRAPSTREEAHEIATYTVIDSLATAVGDKQTAKLARDIRREEERMQKFLGGLLPELSVDVAHDEIPVSEIEGAASRVTARGAAGAKASGGAKACEDRRRPKQDFESKRPIVESKQGQGLTVGAGVRPDPGFRGALAAPFWT